MKMKSTPNNESAFIQELMDKAGLSKKQAEKATSLFRASEEVRASNDPAVQYLRREEADASAAVGQTDNVLEPPNTKVAIYQQIPVDELALIELTRAGITYSFFEALSESCSFSLKDWSAYLHITERTLQRYKKERKPFEGIHAQRIIEIAQLYKKGLAVFGKLEYIHTWMNSEIIALGGIRPKEHLDNAFGIGILHNELVKIEHGVLA